jgi:sterol 22-desaturase
MGEWDFELRLCLSQVYMVLWGQDAPADCCRFVVIASTRDMARKVFNSPMYVKPCVVDVAHKLLRPTNWVFLDGKAHVEYRKGLNGLFTRSALEIYLPGQEEVYNKYFAKFLEISRENHGKPVPWMPVFRELMCAVSCRTFVGHYMTDRVVKRISDDYYLITAALELVNFPVIFPFSKTWYGKKAADMVLEEFAKCAAKSKVRIAAGGHITCIMDAWIKSMQDSEIYRKKIGKGVKVDDFEKPAMLLRDFSDFEIAQTIFTFLFASQDATSSASTWLFQIMADRPDLLNKVREENLRLRGGDKNAPFSMDLLESMVYTQAIVKETLRYRPPVIMVPYEVKKDFPIADNYVVKKGSMVIPSVWPATHDPEAYPNPDSFDPERWITGDAHKQSKNWLVFGTGPHYCLGQTYAQLNLVAMIGKASMDLDWEHHATPLSEDIKVFATIFPQVSRLVKSAMKSAHRCRMTALWSSQSDREQARLDDLLVHAASKICRRMGRENGHPIVGLWTWVTAHNRGPRPLRPIISHTTAFMMQTDRG